MPDETIWQYKESLLGRILNNLWGGKVKRLQVSPEGDAGYDNVRRRSVEVFCKNEIRDLNGEMLKRINLLCCNCEGWVVSASPAENRVRLLKLSSPEITIEGRCLVCDVIITLDPAKIVMRTHGKEVSLKDVFGEDVVISLHTIDTIVRLVDATSLCIGHLEITAADNNLLQVPVSDSRVLDITMNNSSKKMLVSSSCMLIATGTKACKNCVYSATLWKNREQKRKIVDRSSPHSKCNLRYFARDGGENK